MTTEYPKRDKRKKQRIMFRMDGLMFQRLQYLSEEQKKDVSKVIRDILEKDLENVPVVITS